MELVPVTQLHMYVGVGHMYNVHDMYSKTRQPYIILYMSYKRNYMGTQPANYAIDISKHSTEGFTDGHAQS